MKKQNLWSKLANITLVIAVLASCKSQTLVPLTREAPVNLSYIDVEAKFCTSDRSIAKQKVKYMFILDHSQSNQPGFADPLTPTDLTNTDSTGARRYAPLVQFINNLIPDPNNLTYFSLVDFNSTAYQPQNLHGFVQDPAVFLNTYAKPDWIGTGTGTAPMPADQGFTNYQAALQLAYQLIRADAMDESFVQTDVPFSLQYHIVFVTDGIPTVATGTAGSQTIYTQTFLTDILPVISGLTNLKNDPSFGKLISGVALNTAYYFEGAPVVEAQTLLQQMAESGTGQYLEFATGQGVMYQAFAPPARNIKMNLADVWVENNNVIAWEDGRLLPDLDGDGLPDEIEGKLSSNRGLRDSDGNGVNDLVEYRTKGVPCKDAACAPANRDLYAICDGFGPVADASNRITFQASANDGLNDCEKFVLGADRSNFDSNGDFIPDMLALKNMIPFISGTNGTYLDPYGDSLNQYSKLKLGYPIPISSKKLLGFEPRINMLYHEAGDSPDVDCYRYTAKHVAVLRPGDAIRVYIIQNNSIINNKPTLKSVSKSWPGGERFLSFQKEEFN